MKSKTSITLTEGVLREVDLLAAQGSNRSRIIEQAVVEYLERRKRADRERRDLEILNRHAQELNDEMEDILSFQADV
ncbi:MAG: ribbon-helix-helix protein, CopG family [Acidobacteriota bacterium]|nr:ribbon-helix-helix protein, CopG family [Acidobacteriota bacterium]